MLASGDAMVAGRSLDEWSERLFPDISMRVTDAYDADSPYSRMVQVRSLMTKIVRLELIKENS